MLFIFTTTLFPHSGGTDSNGCHSGSQSYHCHGDSSSDSGSDSSSSSSIGKITLGAVVALLAVYLVLKIINEIEDLGEKSSEIQSGKSGLDMEINDQQTHFQYKFNHKF